MREIPIGIQDFKAIRDNGGYFVDKSALIDSILGRRLVAVHLFTRLRRFGKSVNLSMLDAYLNIRYAGNAWFEGLEVSELRPDDPEKNSYPVVMMDLKNLRSTGQASFLNKVRILVSDICKRFPELSDPLIQDATSQSRFHLFVPNIFGIQVQILPKAACNNYSVSKLCPQFCRYG